MDSHQQPDAGATAAERTVTIEVTLPSRADPAADVSLADLLWDALALHGHVDGRGGAEYQRILRDREGEQDPDGPGSLVADAAGAMRLIWRIVTAANTVADGCTGEHGGVQGGRREGRAG